MSGSISAYPALMAPDVPAHASATSGRSAQRSAATTRGHRTTGARYHAGRVATQRAPGGPPPHGAGPSHAAEEAAAYDIGADLRGAIERLAAMDIDALGDAQLTQHLTALKAPLGQLRALQARWAATLESRRVAAAPPRRQRAAQREARNALADQQQLTPSEAKRLVEAGRAATTHRATGSAFDAGRISAEHVRVIAQLLRHVTAAQQAELEPRLVELAQRHHATRFGREARRLLAERCPPAAADAEDLLRGRRYLRATDTPDGGFALSGLLYGTAAETARVALDAFTRPDTAGEDRTREQAAADGFEQLCAAALRTDAAPTQHGARPQILVSIDAAQLAAVWGEHVGTSSPDTHTGDATADSAGDGHGPNASEPKAGSGDGVQGAAGGAGRGVGTFVWSGQPVTSRELGHLFDDCTLVGVLRDAERAPIEVTTKVRTVPTGLWHALVARDGGCTWPGCDAPAAWCDVAHGQVAFAAGGCLTPANAALLCRSHHRRFDHGEWTIHVAGDQVTYLRGGGDSRAGPGVGSQPDLLSGSPPLPGGQGTPRRAPPG